MQPRDDERNARAAVYITDLRMPKEPFGIAAGSVRTGHNPGDPRHPAWCAADECTAGAADFGHHLSSWQIIYPGHAGDAAVYVRLFSDGGEPVEERPSVELVWMRPGQCTSIEGFELRAEQAHALAAVLRQHVDVVGDEQHWTQQVQS